MTLSLLAALISIPSTPAAPVALGRIFALGEKQAYQVRGHLYSERRMGNLSTWIPSDLDLSYTFTTQVTALKADGIAVMHYLRPTMTQVEGETFDTPAKTKVEKLNLDFQLVVSPVNEILDMKDLTPKKQPKPKKAGNWKTAAAGRQVGVALFDQFIEEVYRLSLCVGSMQSVLDFAPRMPFEPTKVGDTWQRTVSYQPQKLKGKDAKQAVQRLDYTYTYKGDATSNGKKVLRVEAKLTLSTDLADFANQLLEMSAEDTGLKKFPLNLDTTILFDLDPKTHHTLHAEAVATGGYQLFVGEREEALIEEKLKGRTTMDLVASKIVKPAKK